MNRTRAVAIGAFSAVIVLLLAVIVYVEAANSSHVVNVWLLKSDVTAGQPFTTDVVQQVQIKGQEGDFAYATDTPSSNLVFRDALHKNDIVREDDLASAANVTNIQLSVANSIDPSASKVDIYKLLTNPADQSECIQLIGSHLPLVSTSGSALTLQVPRADEAAWLITTQSAGQSMLAATSGSQIASSSKLCSPEALTKLEQSLPTPAS